MRWLLVVAAFCALAPAAQAWGQEKVVTMDRESIRPISGSWSYYNKQTAIGGKLYDGYATLGGSSGAAFDVRGYDRFTASVGYRDDGLGREAEASVVLDGEVVWRERIIKGEQARQIDVSLSGHQALTLKCQGTWFPVFAEPRLIKGAAQAPGSAAGGGGGATTTSVSSAPQLAPPAAFAVDPNDLDKLSQGLRQTVDEDPALKERAAGKVAIATFVLVGIPSPDVAQNVAEDLTTALIQKRFKLVERGQLDKILQELKIQNSGLIDPDTAQQIGKQTGCDLILVGSISDRGGFVVVNARLMETATGQSVAAQRVEMRKIPIERR